MPLSSKACILTYGRALKLLNELIEREKKTTSSYIKHGCQAVILFLNTLINAAEKDNINDSDHNVV